MEPGPQSLSWTAAGESSRTASTIATARVTDSVAHTIVRGREYVPPKPLFPDAETETEFYSRSAFTAWEYALSLNRHHPRLWEAVKGSPYERLYRTRFHPADL